MPIRPLLLLLSAGALLFVAAGGMSAPVPRGPRPPVPYYATAPGTVWVYDCGDQRSTETLTSAVEEGGRTTLTFAYGEPGKPESGTGQLVVTPDTILDPGGSGGQLDPPVPVLKLPAKQGDSWPAATRLRTDTTPKEGLAYYGVVEVLKVEKVTVPAGTFEAVCVSAYPQKGHIFFPGTGCKKWYAPGVGVVKIDDGKDVWVLKSFTPGK